MLIMSKSEDDRKVKDVVRLALSCSLKKRFLKRDELIDKLGLKSGPTSELGLLLDEAQQVLRNLFGLELVDIKPSHSKLKKEINDNKPLSDKKPTTQKAPFSQESNTSFIHDELIDRENGSLIKRKEKRSLHNNIPSSAQSSHQRRNISLSSYDKNATTSSSTDGNVSHYDSKLQDFSNYLLSTSLSSTSSYLMRSTLKDVEIKKVIIKDQNESQNDGTFTSLTDKELFLIEEEKRTKTCILFLSLVLILGHKNEISYDSLLSYLDKWALFSETSGSISGTENHSTIHRLEQYLKELIREGYLLSESPSKDDRSIILKWGVRSKVEFPVDTMMPLLQQLWPDMPVEDCKTSLTNLITL